MITMDNGVFAPLISKLSQTESEASIPEHSYVCIVDASNMLFNELIFANWKNGIYI